MFLEPLTFDGAGSYTLSNVKEFDVTDGFLSLGEKVTNCQNKESFEECETKEFFRVAREKCNCVPFSLSHLNRTVDQILTRIFYP